MLSNFEDWENIIHFGNFIASIGKKTYFLALGTIPVTGVCFIARKITGYNDHFRSNTDPCYIQNRTCYKEVEVYMYLYIAFNFACTVDVFASV